MLRRKLVLGASAALAAGKSHIVSLSFDDGFKKSFYTTADIFERHGLRACLNVIAIGHTPEFSMARLASGGANTDVPLGNFDDWNKLKRRGHEVMAHTYDHANLANVPLPQAKDLIDRCAAYFEEHLDGFRARDSVYSFAYNSSNGELDAYALSRFLAIRTRGPLPVNPIPSTRKPTRVGCISRGPGNIDAFLEDEINKFLDSDGGWYVFNSHGLDAEGWGPMTSAFLDRLLARLTKLPHVEVLPVGDVLLRLSK